MAEDEYSGDYLMLGHYIKWGGSLYKLQYDETNLEIGYGRNILHVIYDDGYYYLTHRRYDADTILSMFVDYPDNNSIFYTVKGIDATCLIDNVVKTLPQTLSNDAKNQALANLGIDMFTNYKNLGGYMFDTPELYYKYKSVDREIAKGFNYYFEYSGVIDENYRVILIYGITEGIITDIILQEGVGNYGGDFETFNIAHYRKNGSGEFVIYSEPYDDGYIYELSININSGVYELKYVEEV